MGAVPPIRRLRSRWVRGVPLAGRRRTAIRRVRTPVGADAGRGRAAGGPRRPVRAAAGRSPRLAGGSPASRRKRDRGMRKHEEVRGGRLLHRPHPGGRLGDGVLRPLRRTGPLGIEAAGDPPRGNHYGPAADALLSDLLQIPLGPLPAGGRGRGRRKRTAIALPVEGAACGSIDVPTSLLPRRPCWRRRAWRPSAAGRCCGGSRKGR